MGRSHSQDGLLITAHNELAVKQKSKPQTVDQLLDASTTTLPTKIPSIDLLAGQGMRRPLPDKVRYQYTPTKSRSREKRPSSQHSSLERSGSRGKYDSSDTDHTPETRCNAVQLAKLRREQKVRAHKLREVQQTRGKLEAKNGVAREEPAALKLKKGRDRTNYDSTVSRFSQLTVSDDLPGPEVPPPPPHTNEVIPIIVVAEQAPTNKARPSKRQKPGRLNLQDANQISRSSVIAVRSESPATSPSIQTGITQISASPQTEPAQASTSSSSQSSPDNTGPITNYTKQQHAISMCRAKSAREPSTQQHLPGSILNTAFPAPPSSFQRVSVASKDTCTTSLSAGTKGSRPESRLEGRIEALERENRLLEAALMAVLRTSGTLNGCPRYVLSKTRENGQTQVKRGGKREGDGERGRSRERVRRGPLSEERRASGVSYCSEESGVSALEVYLGTRMGPKVGGISS